MWPVLPDGRRSPNPREMVEEARTLALSSEKSTAASEGEQRNRSPGHREVVTRGSATPEGKLTNAQIYRTGLHGRHHPKVLGLCVAGGGGPHSCRGW